MKAAVPAYVAEQPAEMLIRGLIIGYEPDAKRSLESNRWQLGWFRIHLVPFADEADLTLGSYLAALLKN